MSRALLYCVYPPWIPSVHRPPPRQIRHERRPGLATNTYGPEDDKHVQEKKTAYSRRGRGCSQTKDEGWRKLRVSGASEGKAGRAGTKEGGDTASGSSLNHLDDMKRTGFIGLRERDSQFAEGEESRTVQGPREPPLAESLTEPTLTVPPCHSSSSGHPASPCVEDLQPHLRLPTHDPASVLTAVLPNAQSFTIHSVTVNANSGSETRVVLGNIQYIVTEDDTRFEKDKIRGAVWGATAFFS
ncbi:hypothetical protein FA13DRAFT_1771399 [Coprinellus micaceus]|uniref:Uncharacterized protein n=1 Tax=Coprinellus micaceus TaxID=71717 RepID=A0A4Y7TSB6_COPMI|nr:hypothetical protein FA13DRAFT_1771399 [Coprinellus micaceus]